MTCQAQSSKELKSPQNSNSNWSNFPDCHQRIGEREATAWANPALNQGRSQAGDGQNVL
jgi:hypothetical protein